MYRFQPILLSLLVCIYLPLSAIAADGAESALNDTLSADAGLAVQENDNIMIRQFQPISGFVPLTVAGQDINATFLEETLGESHGAIVFFHDQGEDLESLGVVTPLRHELLQYGWSTLTVTLDYPSTPNIFLAVEPEADTPPEEDITSAGTNSSTTTDSAQVDDTNTDDANKDETGILATISNKQRIEQAITFLETKGIQRIIFLGHGRGGIVAINELSTTAISALILVGTPALINGDEFKAFNQPILEVYGSQDMEGVSVAVSNRKVVMKRAGNILYTSREIMGANHVFYGLEPILASTVRGWLYTTFVKQEKNE